MNNVRHRKQASFLVDTYAVVVYDEVNCGSSMPVAQQRVAAVVTARTPSEALAEWV
jgi:hypothetical protein